MSTDKSTWSYKDFLAFVMLYAANANFEVNKEEEEVFFSKVDFPEYDHVYKEFEKENDYGRLQTIQSFKFKYFNDEGAKDKLFKDLKDMFLADEKYDSVERAFFMGLRRVL